MTDLTEQLYAGTLPTGHYYFNNGVETYIVLYKNINTKDRKLQEPSGLTVLSKVPSYKEWKAKLEENTKLKELLKEARNVLKMVDTYYGDYDSINGFLIVEKINQALGEDK